MQVGATSCTCNTSSHDQKALSDFADYVEKQQALRRPAGQAQAKATATDQDDHDELDNILDQLGLTDEASSRIPLKRLLLDPGEENGAALADHLRERLDEDRGEALFDVGLDDSGDSMGFTRADWDAALVRVAGACEQLQVDYKVLMTRNVGGDVEVGAASQKDTALSGKLFLRRRPQSVDEVIETRIAVVGNGECMSWLLFKGDRGYICTAG